MAATGKRSKNAEKNFPLEVKSTKVHLRMTEFGQQKTLSALTRSFAVYAAGAIGERSKSAEKDTSL